MCVCVCVCAVSYTHLDVYKRQRCTQFKYRVRNRLHFVLFIICVQLYLMNLMFDDVLLGTGDALSYYMLIVVSLIVYRLETILNACLIDCSITIVDVSCDL